jgi:hypothetical protein
MAGRTATDEAQWDFVYACYANTYAVRRKGLPDAGVFSLLAERMPQSIRVVLARQGSRPVAMAFSLVGGQFLWSLLGVPGRIRSTAFRDLFYQGMDYAIANGFQRFDAGAQGEHKLIRGFEPVITLLALPAPSGLESGGQRLPAAGEAGCAGVCRGGADGFALSAGLMFTTKRWTQAPPFCAARSQSIPTNPPV